MVPELIFDRGLMVLNFGVAGIPWTTGGKLGVLAVIASRLTLARVGLLRASGFA